MERRVEVSEWVEFQWPYLIAFLGGEARLAELARETGAFERARKIGSPSDLLRLLLFRGGGVGGAGGGGVGGRARRGGPGGRGRSAVRRACCDYCGAGWGAGVRSWT